MSSSLMRSFDKKRYAALVFAQSWQASGMLSPTAAPICSSKLPNLLPRRRSSNSQPAISCSIQLFAWAAERPRALSRPSLHIIKAPLRRDSGAQEGITNDSSDSRIRKIASAERRGEMWVIESYGEGIREGLTENDECRPQTLYAESKLAVEGALRELSGSDFETVILRNATVFGLSPRMRFDLAINIMTLRAWKERLIYIMGGGDQWRPFIH